MHSAAELIEIEEESTAAKFREVRAKLAQDCANLTQYHASLEETKRRQHVVMVMHEKGQVQTGKQLLVPCLVFILFLLISLGFFGHSESTHVSIRLSSCMPWGSSLNILFLFSNNPEANKMFCFPGLRRPSWKNFAE